MIGPGDLPEVLRDVLSAQPRRRSVRRYVAYCHGIARTYLRGKSRTGGMELARIGSDLDDLALDCIADLFERDHQGRFPKLIDYYERRAWQEQEGSALARLTRRLVFSAVNQGLFERYRQVDTSLSRVIRNLKSAIGSSEDLATRRIAGTLWLVTTSDAEESDAEEGATSFERPVMPPELLEAQLTPHVREPFDLGALVAAVGKYLAGQAVYRPAYPVTHLALAVRAATVRVGEASRDGSRDAVRPPWTQLRPDEIQAALDEAVRQARERFHATYVESGKVDEDVFAAYMKALRDKLAVAYGEAGRQEVTNHEALVAHLPGLSYEAYRAEHRAVFEYIDKTTRGLVVALLEQDL